MRKHSGINKQTGRLKKGYKYSGKKLKSGLPQIIKIKKSKKGGGILKKNAKNQYSSVFFDDNVNVIETDFNDCPKGRRLKEVRKLDDEGVKIKHRGCKSWEIEYKTPRGYPCCKNKKEKFEEFSIVPRKNGKKQSMRRNPEKLSNKQKPYKPKVIIPFMKLMNKHEGDVEKKNLEVIREVEKKNKKKLKKKLKKVNKKLINKPVRKSFKKSIEEAKLLESEIYANA